ncbi:hypothetical protein [Pontiella sulfatireligans]|uniref:Uncharacterized protein n=1 Tax=Pontiella sulfatireligans TaxID=2750658 RepID=A0A6C2UKQ6_9BACT|nr:hypothetical protein [Pontiella sulfatireligans]VGO19766.1 hypothetical protein SCARR_01825 [Pontiella sulfatireligans]
MKVRIICLLMIAVSSFGEPRVVPVPWDWTDPSIPHPVYPGRKARIKAIARDCASTVYYRVDVDGDYVWDTDWLTGNRYNIEHLHFYPSSPGQTGYTRYTAIIECKETPTSESFYGSYPVMMCHDVSTVENTHEATLHQLAVMRALAVDEALWYLHKNLVRTDEGVATISGYINAPAPLVRLACSALCTMAMQSNHHMAAFPPGTYNDFSQSVPEGFLSLNDWRYENDPYAEDLLRLHNYLLSNIKHIDIPVDDEANDGTLPISGTDDGKGFYTESYDTEYNRRSLVVHALAGSGLTGVRCQVANTNVNGRLMEFVVQQMVDFGIAAQIDGNSPTNAIGGWGASPYMGTGTSAAQANAYISGGWYVALLAAERQMGSAGVYVNQRLKERIPNMLWHNQHSNGGSRYNNAGTTYPDAMFEPVGYALLACRWLGWDQWSTNDTAVAEYPYLVITRGESRQCYDRYLQYAQSNWTNSSAGTAMLDPGKALWKSGDFDQSISSGANLWSMSLYGMSLALAYADGSSSIRFPGTHDWFREFLVGLAKQQAGTAIDPLGYYDEAGTSFISNGPGRFGATALAVLAMTCPDYEAHLESLIPTNLNIVASNHSIQVFWDMLDGVETYQVESTTNLLVAFQSEPSGQSIETGRWEGTSTNKQQFYQINVQPFPWGSE